ncbi:MAG: HlyD family secretion protein [Burkholderiaceae bacterium]|jgi:membrane fusion protein (multidrug efflux system)
MSEAAGERPRSWSAAVWRTLLIVLAIVILYVVIARWSSWEGARGWQTTDDAYLQADITPIAAKVSGYVRAVPVADYQKVHAGEVLVELVDDDYRAAVAQSEANLASAKAQLESLKAQRALQEANVQAATAVVAATSANLEQNGRDIEREKRLLEIGSSSIEASERLETARRQITAQLDQNRAQAQATTRQLAVLAAQQGQAEAAIAAQLANLDVAKLNLGYTRIVAPTEGVIGQRQVLPGQFVAVAGQVTTLTPLPHVWVTANFKETQLTHMAVGDRAEVSVDTYPGQKLKGHVIAFAPASGSQFALLPPDNATGNFTKVVQRVSVKIALDDTDGLGEKLRPGMSVVVRVDAKDGDK